ncbi:MAG: hypothetical protein ABIK13_00355 [Patescibacteria group bacterium]
MAENVTYQQIVEKILDAGSVWVRLYDGIKICLIDVIVQEPIIFIGKFLPCASNSKEYKIKFSEVKEFV